MSNFSPKLEDATDEQLKYWINENDFRVVPLASDELTRRALKKLQETIEKLDKNTTRYSWALFCLTFLLFIVAIFQIIVSLGMVHQTKWSGVIFMGLLLCVIVFSATQMFKRNKK